MKQLAIFLFLLNCCALTVSAQQFSFKVITKGFTDGEKLYLSKYHGREEILIDSVSGSGQKEFKIKTPLPIRGLYLVHASKNALAELIISPDEELIVEVDKAQLSQGKITIHNSAENNAYADFAESYFKYDMVFNVLASERYGEFDAKYITKLKSRTTKMAEAQLEFYLNLGVTQRIYPRSYVTDVLMPLVDVPVIVNEDYSDKYDNYHAFLFHHFWDNAKLDDEEVLNHFLLNEMLKNYFRHFVPKNPDSLKVAIDYVLDKSAGNEKVQAHMRAFLLRSFMNSNADDLTAYIMNKGDGETCGLNLSPEELKKLEAIKSLDIGMVAPNVSLPDVNQQKITLSEVYGANKLTAVVFWTAHCSACKAELPQLKQLYEQYKQQGFQVYAINLDENKFNWRDALDKYQFAWVNVTDDVPLKDSKVLPQFNVSRTPTVYLLNNKGLILCKNKFGDSLREEVEKHIGH